jgi:hypothetical protein
MMKIAEAVQLNNSDSVCSLDDTAAVAQQAVGTSDFHWPKLADWLSLALSFMLLHMLISSQPVRQHA